METTLEYFGGLMNPAPCLQTKQVQKPIHIKREVYQELGQKIMDINAGGDFLKDEILIDIGKFTGSLDFELLFYWRYSNNMDGEEQILKSISPMHCVFTLYDENSEEIPNDFDWNELDDNIE